MKLEAVRRNVETSGTLESNRFTIEMNSAAVDILSSKIYTNNYLAIVRELSCNAWDSHVAAGNSDKPFEVTFPSSLKSEFKVRDFGTGMSHDNVMYLYTTYFGSDKRDTNDAIGGLGLGSKAPFAYTDAFTVRSFYNGEVRSYAIYRDDENLPKCDLLDTLPTNEPSGMEVTVAVKATDYYKFKEQASRALRWFPTTPIVYGTDDITPPEWNLKTRTCGMLKTDNRYGPARVLMGSVIYDLDRDQINYDKKFNNKVINSFLRSPTFVLFADIGDLSIAASREDLNYTKTTVTRLYQLLETAAKEVQEQIEEELKGETRIPVKYFKRATLPGALQSLIQMDNTMDFPEDEVVVREIDSSTWHRKTGFVSNPCVDKIVFHGSKHPKVIINDVKRSPYRQIVMEHDELKPDKIDIRGWNRRYSTADQSVLILEVKDKDALNLKYKKFLKEFDPDFVYKISDYYQPTNRTPGVSATTGQRVKTAYVNPKVRKRQLYFTRDLPTSSSSYYWNAKDIALEELTSDHILVGFHGNTVRDHDANVRINSNQIKLANLLIGNDQEFVGIPKNIWKTAKKCKVLRFADWFEIEIQDYINNLTIDKYLQYKHPNLIKEKIATLLHFAEHASTWEKFAPDSLACFLSEKHKTLANERRSSTEHQKITLIEDYRAKTLYDVDLNNLPTVFPELIGANEWLCMTYPELTKYFTDSRWTQINEMTGHYVNLKEGLVK